MGSKPLLAVSMFTQPGTDYPLVMKAQDLWRFLDLEGVSAVEIVPSLIWGPVWDDNLDLDLSGLPPISSVQSIFFGLTGPLSRFPPTTSQRESWFRRLSGLEALASRIKGAVFVVGAPGLRRLGGATDSEAELSLRDHLRAVADAVTSKGSLVALENCTSQQGAEFCVGLSSSLSVASSVRGNAVGINLDLEAALAEGLADVDPKSFCVFLEESGVAVHTIQVGLSAMGGNRQWICEVIGRVTDRGTVKAVAIEDARIPTWDDLKDVVGIVGKALGIHVSRKGDA